MTTTKHEGKCCANCLAEIRNGSHLEEDSVCICSCHSAEPTGAGMEEEELIKVHQKSQKPYLFADDYDNAEQQDAASIKVLRDYFEARLYRLHSRIVEEVEKKEEFIFSCATGKESDAAQQCYNQAKQEDKEIINQAFKDL